jgi:hypothetical protein
MTVSFIVTSAMTLMIGQFSDSLGLEQTYEYVAYIGAGAIPFAILFNKQHCHC